MSHKEKISCYQGESTKCNCFSWFLAEQKVTLPSRICHSPTETTRLLYL